MVCLRLSRNGFTKIELLVVAVAISILLAMLMPALHTTRRGGHARSHCSNNLKQLALASLNYESAHQHLAAGVIDDDDDLTDAMHSGFVELLPYLEQGGLYDAYDRKVSWNSEANLAYADAALPILSCPSNQNNELRVEDLGGISGTTSDYAFCKGASAYLGDDVEQQNGAFDVNSTTGIAHFTDGTSNTILFGEAISSRNVTANVHGKKVAVGQLWLKANFDGAHELGHAGGRGSCLAVVGQHAGRDGEWGTDDDLVTPINQSPTEVSVDVGGSNDLSSATDRVRGFHGPHDGFVNFAFADGSAHSIPNDVSPRVMVLLSVRNDGKVVETEF